MSMTPTSVRLDDDLKKEAAKELALMGLSTNAYLNMALRQLVLQKKIPFEIFSRPLVPNDVTEKALVKARAKELGLIPDDSPAFDNPDDALKYLDNEN